MKKKWPLGKLIPKLFNLEPNRPSFDEYDTEENDLKETMRDVRNTDRVALTNQWSGEE